MKKIIFLMTISAAFSACDKVLGLQRTCDVEIKYAVPGVAIKGFSIAEIDSAKVYRYKANTGLSELISVEDVSIGGPPKVLGGIAFSFSYYYETRGFFYIEKGIDYKVNIGNVPKEFIITNVRSGPTSKIVTQNTPCDKFKFSPVSYNMKINGEEMMPEYMEGGFYIVLQP